MRNIDFGKHFTMAGVTAYNPHVESGIKVVVERVSTQKIPNFGFAGMRLQKAGLGEYTETPSPVAARFIAVLVDDEVTEASA